MRAFQNVPQFLSRRKLSCSETDIDPQKQGVGPKKPNTTEGVDHL